MSAHNNFFDIKLPIESDSGENSPPNVENTEITPSARNTNENCLPNAAQDTQPLQHDCDTVLDMIGAALRLLRAVVCYIFNNSLLFSPHKDLAARNGLC